MKKFVTKSSGETAEVAAALGAKISSSAVIAFTGDLGAGKTTFIKGLAKALGYSGEVSSPTFAIVHEYIGGRLPLYHFDMYRVESWESLYSTGFFEYMETDAVLAVEWSENIENALPDDLITVDITRGEDDNERVILISSRGEIKIEDIGD
ncbi:MAG: tRNA (adenosine(37)-N6)-threonylcarbamoyltransferase complex ATPase subunit type 1 TsaE [Clostridia bacterium]|nr:tRNA (adenosine(37)-N6)-threonylcarbamoyltransferase complex ATPase subunit type 1 TsaE [Clostridia bacterium]MBQ2388986.1 tRNA (adenosine(37)-N6)-threonylcarbamoyltransferase complex ATPase subunit type 1 TsaE [Clostridia bacterium]MBQ5717135.1 tRNA (adenosine(37)-N6)-threonylcarbamoyltransferase complex ATPase subunit type 1 TsaE [Clostridia bacterium]